jgi:hypothetical protein
MLVSRWPSKLQQIFCLICAMEAHEDTQLTISGPKRWMAEIFYRTGRDMEVFTFEELAELHDIVEMGPNWNEIERIVVTLNLDSADLER